MLQLFGKIVLFGFALYFLLVEIILTSIITENFEGNQVLFVELVIAVLSMFIGSRAAQLI